MRRNEEERGVSIGALVAAVVGDFNWDIVEVWAQQGGTKYTLYTPSGGKKTVQLTPGANWELHVQWECVNNNKGLTGWTAAITVVASGVPIQYQQQWKPQMMEIASSFKSDFALNMGAMPSANVTITRIKFWATQVMPLSGAAPEPPPTSSW